MPDHPNKGRREERTDVQTSVLGEEYFPVGVSDALWFLVESPFDVLSFPDVPHGPLGRIEDLGNPHISHGKVHRRGEDGGGSGEESGKSGHEFHR